MRERVNTVRRTNLDTGCRFHASLGDYICHSSSFFPWPNTGLLLSIFLYFLRLLHFFRDNYILDKQRYCVIHGWFINYFTIANKKFQAPKNFYQEVLILGYANADILLSRG